MENFEKEAMKDILATRKALMNAIRSTSKVSQSISSVYMTVSELLEAMVIANIEPVKLSNGLLKLLDMLAPKYDTKRLQLTKFAVEMITLEWEKGREMNDGNDRNL